MTDFSVAEPKIEHRYYQNSPQDTILSKLRLFTDILVLSTLRAFEVVVFQSGFTAKILNAFDDPFVSVSPISLPVTAEAEVVVIGAAAAVLVRRQRWC
jgi:hypothetical protein